MPKQFGSQVDLQKIPILNIVIHSSTSEPTTPVNGQFWFDTTAGLMKVREGGVWVLVGNTTGGSAPTGPAGGDLTGTYPNPTIGLLKVITGYLADGAVTSLKIADGTIVDGDVATANKDGADATASMRTLGYTAGKAMPGIARLDQIAVPNTSVSMLNQRLTLVADPATGTDAANKNYVDGVAQGLDAKPSVRAATTGNITLSGPQTVDGVALIATNRCLVKNQSSPQQNGIYIVGTVGWAGPGDMDVWSDVPSAYVFVEEGTVNKDTGWVSTADATGTMDTTPMPWTQFSGAGSMTAGAGMTQTGTTFDVGGTTNRITVAADAVDIAATYVGQASITTVGTITTGAWDGTDIPVSAGGTGANSSGQARINLGATGYFAGTLPALTPGVEHVVTHSLGSRNVIAGFQVAATGRAIELDWRTISISTLGVTADIAYAASAVDVVVIGAGST